MNEVARVTAAQPPAPSLASLAKRLRSANKKFGGLAARLRKQGYTAYQLAVECGTLLLEAKELCKRGEFGPWCDKHCEGISERTRQNYMRVAESYLNGTNGQKTLKEAYAELGLLPPYPPPKGLPVIEAEVVQDAPGAVLAATAPTEVEKPAITQPVSVAVAAPAARKPSALDSLEDALAGMDLKKGVASPDGTVSGPSVKTPTERATPQQVPRLRELTVKVGPPLTPALLTGALNSLLELVPDDAKVADYALSLETAAKLLVQSRQPSGGYSPYTS